MNDFNWERAAETEHDRLIEDINGLKAELAACVMRSAVERRKNDYLNWRVKQMREVLEWYGARDVYGEYYPDTMEIVPIFKDRGKRARDVSAWLQRDAVSCSQREAIASPLSDFYGK